jgi:hypothetical protein
MTEWVAVDRSDPAVARPQSVVARAGSVIRRFCSRSRLVMHRLGALDCGLLNIV